ncbi:hypothetical protein CRM22_003152 [Opisthorchis felineus]|uniref:RING-type domain-containing protein n=1 Tax=Opisthorchis felineus TaxID=147828 RepID=A0A4S2M8V8_OPIFE|nr:hypothetical protein CRM22_003152 [Opisthorchis felineus]
MPQAQSIIRFFMWPFSSELCLFLTLSSLSLILCILESVWFPDTVSEDSVNVPDVDGTIGNASDVDSTGFDRSSVEAKSFLFWSVNTKIFVSAVLCLFGATFIAGKTLYYVFFGKLAETEKNQLTRMLFKFVFLRFVILSGAISVSSLSSLFGWLLWFAGLGLLRSCAAIAAVRTTQFYASSRISQLEWIRIFSVLTFLGIGNGFLLKMGLSYRTLLADSGVYSKISSMENRLLTGALKPPTALGVLISKVTGNKEASYNTVDIMAYIGAESVLLFSSTIRLFGDMTIQAYDRWILSSGGSWPQQTLVSYYLDFVHVVFYHTAEILHYLHLLLWSRIFSVASLIVFLHTRSTYSMLATRIRRHMSYRRLGKFIVENFTLCKMGVPVPEREKTNSVNLPSENTPEISKTNKEALEEDPTVCAICWEPLVVWRRLPCRHEFHEFCLRNWLEQNSTCPTCRRELGTPTVPSQSARSVQQDQVALGLLLRNLVRRVDTRINQQRPLNTPGPHLRPGMAPQVDRVGGVENPVRSLFAATVGLNLGVSIGSAPIVSAAAQAAARNAVPGSTSSRNVPLPAAYTPHQSMGGPITTALRSTSLPATTQNVPRHTTQGEDMNTDPNSQVLRRSFHFDGSRYFSWLPSLHVELSEVIREVFASGSTDQVTEQTAATAEQRNSAFPSVEEQEDVNRPELTGTSFDAEAYELIRLPSNLRVAAQEISAMFPQFPLSVIVADLLATGLPEVTVENLIHRPIPLQPRRATSGVHALQAGPLTQSTPPEIQEDPVRLHTVDDQSTGTPLALQRRSLLERARQRFFARDGTSPP